MNGQIDFTQLESLVDSINSLEKAQKFTISQAIFLKEFDTYNVKNHHPTFGGVLNGNKVPVIGKGKDYNGFESYDGCTLPECTITASFSDFEWCIKPYGCRVKICMNDLAPKFQVFWNLYKKDNEGDMATAFVQFLVELFQDKHLNAEFRISYFGVEGATVTIDDAEVPQPEIDACDGFIVRASTMAKASQDTKDKMWVEITQNAKATNALQTITDGHELYTYLSAIYSKASVQPWWKKSKPVWRINQYLAQLMAGYLNTASDLSQYNCDCIDPSKVVGDRGFTWDNLKIFGINVEALDFEGAMQSQPYYWNGTKFTQFKNIIILADPNTMLLGYEETESLHSFDLFYDKMSRNIVMDGTSRFGSAVSVPEFVIGI